MRNFGIILVSHGEFAKATLGSVEMIAGKQEDVIAYELDVDKSLETLYEELSEGIASLKEKHENVLVLCDLYGGTPFNTVVRKLIEGEKLISFTGFNLPLVIELALAGELTVDEIKETVKSTFEASLVDLETII